MALSMMLRWTLRRCPSSRRSRPKVSRSPQPPRLRTPMGTPAVRPPLRAPSATPSTAPSIAPSAAPLPRLVHWPADGRRSALPANASWRRSRWDTALFPVPTPCTRWLPFELTPPWHSTTTVLHLLDGTRVRGEVALLLPITVGNSSCRATLATGRWCPSWKPTSHGASIPQLPLRRRRQRLPLQLDPARTPPQLGQRQWLTCKEWLASVVCCTALRCRPTLMDPNTGALVCYRAASAASVVWPCSPPTPACECVFHVYMSFCVFTLPLSTHMPNKGGSYPRYRA
mmetsp:Transcript_2840/g.8620  ORF Transcript_2840/g.8620 Transcript_2840/m.8620 type:complete len:285 (+) Transcript_2840:1504-2358(+)